MKLGIDIGSTTIKCVLLNREEKIIYKSYVRHELKIKDKLLELLKDLKIKLEQLSLEKDLKVAFSGSFWAEMTESILRLFHPLPHIIMFDVDMS